MGFMDNASYYVGRGIGSADKAAKTLKIQAEITKLESQKKDLIQQLGSAVYAKSKNDDAVNGVFSNYITPIAAAESRIAGCRERLVELQNEASNLVDNEASAVCPKCGTRNPVSYSFCISCGTKMQHAHTGGNEWVCTGCGASYDSEMAFCVQCGKPVRNRGEEQVEEKTRPDDCASPSTDGSENSGVIDPEDTGNPEGRIVEARSEAPMQDGVGSADEQADRPPVCPSCGSPIEPGDVFCGECGQSL